MPLALALDGRNLALDEPGPDRPGAHAGAPELHRSLHQLDSIPCEVFDAYRRAVEQHAAVSITDLEGNILYVNELFCRVSGYAREELIGNTHRVVKSGHHSEEFWRELWETVAAGHVWHGEICNRARDGTIFWSASTLSPLAAGGRIHGYMAVRHPITALKRARVARRRLAQRDAYKKSVLNSLSYAVIGANADSVITVFNRGAERLLGYRAEELLGKRALEGLCEPESLRAHADDLRMLRENGEAPVEGEWTLLRKDGSRIRVFLSLTALRSPSGGFNGYLGVAHDSARVDPLTGLANRVDLTEQLTAAIGEPARPFALLYLDLDGFKQINDSLGHSVGDLALRQLAERVRAALAGSPPAGVHMRTAARMGGDEFVVLLEGPQACRRAPQVAKSLIEALGSPCRVGEHEFHLSASVGIITSEFGYLTAEEYLRDADTAMYEAKRCGCGGMVVFDSEMHDRVQRNLLVQTDLPKALREGQLQLMYQPLMCLETGRLRGCEALLRWRHPRLGWISPQEFIPVAERSGFIFALGDWVLRSACAQFGAWRARFAERAPCSVNVNLSRIQLFDPDLPRRIDAALAEHGVEPWRLHLEITETAVMQQPEAALVILRELRSLGVTLELDDFGTGYSSLCSIHELPIEGLKIDRSFVRDLETSPRVEAVIETVCRLARQLRMKVVAEGIETSEQLMAVQRLGCDLGQGYLFARPLEPERFEEAFLVPGLKVCAADSPGPRSDGGGGEKRSSRPGKRRYPRAAQIVR